MLIKQLNYFRKTFWTAEKYAIYLGVKLSRDVKIEVINFILIDEAIVDLFEKIKHLNFGSKGMSFEKKHTF